MPALKGSEVSRVRLVDVEVLPPWLQRQIEWDRSAPRCDACKRPMSAYMRELGAATHPSCDRFDWPTQAEIAEGKRIMREHRRGPA